MPNLATDNLQNPRFDSMTFEDGTALKKIHYEDFRFSEDLDFTCSDDISDDFIG